MKPRTSLAELARRLLGDKAPADPSELPEPTELGRLAVAVREGDPREPGFFAGLGPGAGTLNEEYYLDLMELWLHLAPTDSAEMARELATGLAAAPAAWLGLIRDSLSSPLAFTTLQHVLQLQLRGKAPVDESPELEALERWAFEVAAGQRERPRRRGRPGEASVVAHGVITITVNLLHHEFGRPYTAAIDSDEEARMSACQVIAVRLGTTTDRIRTIWARGRKQGES